MYPVEYSEQYGYRIGEAGDSSPLLTISIRNPFDTSQALEVDAVLDSGCQISIFQGWTARMIGLDIMEGRPWQLQGAAGWAVDARRLRVSLEHADLGAFFLEPAFPLGEVRRNLLGRDFFNLIQLGFREQHLVFYVEPHP